MPEAQLQDTQRGPEPTPELTMRDLHLMVKGLYDHQKDGFAEVNSRLDGIDGRLDGIDGRLDGIDGRLDNIEGDLSEVKSNIKLLLERVG